MALSLDEIRSWVGRVTATLQLLLDNQVEMDAVSVQRHFAVAEDNQRLVLKLTGELDRRNKKHEMFIETLRLWTDCTDMESVGTLLSDMQVRLQSAMVKFQAWREALAMFEFRETMEGRERRLEDAQQLITLEQEYEVQLALVRVLIPRNGELV